MKHLLLYMTVLVIFSIHFVFTNGLEKMLIHFYADSPHVRRPDAECSSLHNPPVQCLGMPSGHVELTTLAGYILYDTKVLSLPVLLLLIVAMAVQRVASNRHTVLQTVVGFLFGLFYAFAYLSLKFSYQKLLLCLFFGFVYTGMLVVYLETHLTEKVPDWVDRNMLPVIEHKKKTPLFYKLLCVVFSAYQQKNILYFSWRDTEHYLETIVENIRRSGTKFDAVVGIKTGGAIISDYLSTQLQIPNYKIKLTRKKFNCNKQISDTYEDINDKYLKKIVDGDDYMVCEGVQEDIKGKNVILIDETVCSGITMNAAIDYILSKEVNVVYPTTINQFTYAKPHPSVQLNSVLVTDYVPVVWPWGYDN